MTNERSDEEGNLNVGSGGPAVGAGGERLGRLAVADGREHEACAGVERGDVRLGARARRRTRDSHVHAVALLLVPDEDLAFRERVLRHTRILCTSTV